MGTRDLPDMYALTPRAWTCISGKSLMQMLFTNWDTSLKLNTLSTHLLNKQIIFSLIKCVNSATAYSITILPFYNYTTTDILT